MNKRAVFTVKPVFFTGNTGHQPLPSTPLLPTHSSIMPLALSVQLDDLSCIHCSRSDKLRMFLQVQALLKVEGVQEQERPPVCLGTTLKGPDGSPLHIKWLPISGRCEHKGCLTLHKGAIRLEDGKVMGLIPKTLIKYEQIGKETPDKKLVQLVQKSLRNL